MDLYNTNVCCYCFHYHRDSEVKKNSRICGRGREVEEKTFACEEYFVWPVKFLCPRNGEPSGISNCQIERINEVKECMECENYSVHNTSPKIYQVLEKVEVPPTPIPTLKPRRKLPIISEVKPEVQPVVIPEVKVEVKSEVVPLVKINKKITQRSLF